MAKPKASTKAPAFQFYPTEFLSDPNVMAMSLAERGAYITLICVCWQQSTIPCDPVQLAKICQTVPDEFRKLWPSISVCFRKSGQVGRLIHPRLEKEREKQRAFRDRQTHAAAMRWQSRGNAAASSGSPSALPERHSHRNALQSLSLSLSVPTEEKKKEQSSAKLAHEGPRLRIWTWQHEDLARRLGAKAETFDLLLWYVTLEDELDRTGESFADPWKWLQERLYRDAKLPLPNLYGKAKQAPATVTPKLYVPLRDRPEDSWK